MISQFEALLQSLGTILHLPLHIDRANACSIQIHESLIIQLELDISQEHLWIFTKVIEVPPGKFRENILRDALKANALPDPLIGTFGFIPTTGHLAFFQTYPLAILNGTNLAGFLGAFIEIATSWHEAIAKGQSPPK